MKELIAPLILLSLLGLACDQAASQTEAKSVNAPMTTAPPPTSSAPTPAKPKPMTATVPDLVLRTFVHTTCLTNFEVGERALDATCVNEAMHCITAGGKDGDEISMEKIMDCTVGIKH